MASKPLTPAELRPSCDPDSLELDTTAQADGLTGILGQARAMDALTFGMGMRSEGYNVFALGPEEFEKLTEDEQKRIQKDIEVP